MWTKGSFFVLPGIELIFLSHPATAQLLFWKRHPSSQHFTTLLKTEHLALSTAQQARCFFLKYLIISYAQQQMVHQITSLGNIMWYSKYRATKTNFTIIQFNSLFFMCWVNSYNIINNNNNNNNKIIIIIIIIIIKSIAQCLQHHNLITGCMLLTYYFEWC
jgi:hypothetical protein